MPEFGDRIHVWPHPGSNVRQFAELNRFLPPEGMVLPWSPWLKERLDDGSIHLTDPAPKPTPVATNKTEG